jgi:hypothetical protein
VARSCEYNDEPSGSGATELVSYRLYKRTCLPVSKFSERKENNLTAN